MKTCTKCHRTLDLSEFYPIRRGDGSIGYRPECKSCKKKVNADNHRERQKAKRGEKHKKHSPLRRAKHESLYQYRCRVIKDAWERAAVRLAEKGQQHEST